MYQDKFSLFAAVTGNALHAYLRPQKTLSLTVVNFVIGMMVTTVLSPAAFYYLKAEHPSVRPAISFAIGFVAMILLPAILTQVEKRSKRLADRAIDAAADLLPPTDKGDE